MTKSYYITKSAYSKIKNKSQQMYYGKYVESCVLRFFEQCDENLKLDEETRHKLKKYKKDNDFIQRVILGFSPEIHQKINTVAKANSIYPKYLISFSLDSDNEKNELSPDRLIFPNLSYNKICIMKDIADKKNLKFCYFMATVLSDSLADKNFKYTQPSNVENVMRRKIYISEKDYTKLTKLCKKNDCTMSLYVEKIIDEYLEKYNMSGDNFVTD